MGKELKAKLEEGHQEAGYRNWSQVLCNSASAFVASLLWTAAYVPDSPVTRLLSPFVPHGVRYNSAEWCAVSSSATDSWSRVLVFVTLGYVLSDSFPR